MGRPHIASFLRCRRGRGGRQGYRDRLRHVNNQRLDQAHYDRRGRHRPRLRTNVGRFYYRNEHELNAQAANSAWKERDLAQLERMKDSEIIFQLSGDLDYLKHIVTLSKKNEKINKMLLKVLERAFRSESTPALMLTVTNTVIETEFIYHTVQSLKTYFENSSYNKSISSRTDSVLAVLRILDRIYSIDQNAITFILGSFVYMSDLMEVIRDFLKVDDLSQDCTCIKREENNTSKIMPLQSYSGIQENNPINSDSQECDREIYADRKSDMDVFESCLEKHLPNVQLEGQPEMENVVSGSNKQHDKSDFCSDNQQKTPDSFSGIQQNYSECHLDSKQNYPDTCSNKTRNNHESHSESWQYLYKPNTQLDSNSKIPETPSDSQQYNPETPSDSQRCNPETPSDSQRCNPETPTDSQRCNPETPSDSQRCNPETLSDSQRCNPETPSDSQRCNPVTPSDSQRCNPETPSGSHQYNPETPTDSHRCNPETPSDSQRCNPETPSDSQRCNPETPSDSQRCNPETPPDSHQYNPETPTDSQRCNPETPSDSHQYNPETPSDSQRCNPETPSDSQRCNPETPSDSQRCNPETPSDSQRCNPETPTDSQRCNPETPTDSQRCNPETPSDSQRCNPETPSDSQRCNPETPSDSHQYNPETPSDSHQYNPETPSDSQQCNPETPPDSQPNNTESHSDSRDRSPECHADIIQNNNETVSSGFKQYHSDRHLDCQQEYPESQSHSQQNNPETHLHKEQKRLETTEEKNNKDEHGTDTVSCKASDLKFYLSNRTSEMSVTTCEEKFMSCSCASPCLSTIEVLFAQLGKHKQECILRCSKTKTDPKRDFRKENFRTIPIYPRLGDLNGDIKPHLRVNKVRGGYRNVDDYLDVQFRLLRQDFVGPLREGINALKGQRNANRTKQIQEIKAYENVKIESFVCGDGLNHVLRFDNRKMKHIRWNMTKRLKYGSLVCLSADDFKTCYFATVVNNDIKFRREGRVHVKFAHQSNIIQGLMGLTFTMIESIAYFEAYRPVLSSLKTIIYLPFEEYLVKCNLKVLPPKYLRKPGADVYDLRCLVEPGAKIHDFVLSDLWFDKKPTVHKRVNILESEWPNEEMFQLDGSQLNALKSALTKEFCIIQGPPGCGKTHIGLEITKVLLQNKCKWAYETRAQLLIVCYTNHALDQFMDGIRSFFRGRILRIGSRCTNENLQQFSLKTIKKQLRNEKKIPRYIYERRVLAQLNFDSLRNDISLVNMEIRILKNNIIHESSLIEEIGDIHGQFRWLKQKMENRRLPRWFRYLYSSGILEWLGILDMADGIDFHRSKHVRYDNTKRNPIDDLTFFENRETMTDAEPDFDDHHMESILLKIFKRDHISFNLEEIDNIHRPYETVEGRNKQILLQEKVKLLLQETQPMSETDALSVKNIRRLSKGQRWALYLFWIQKKCNELYSDTEAKIEQFKKANDVLKEVNMMEERYICNDADVIGMTVTGAAIHKTILIEVQPTIMIVEEAAEVFESQLISNLTPACQHLILIGDHKQLRPKPNMYELEKNYNMGISLFERMIMNDFKCDCLQVQHRMRPQIADNIRHVYETLEDHDSVKQYESIRGISQSIFLINHCEEEKKDEELKSYTNAHEVKYLVALCKYLLLQGYDASKVTLLTMYRGQMFLLKKRC